jgi:hypothetical protein
VGQTDLHAHTLSPEARYAYDLCIKQPMNGSFEPCHTDCNVNSNYFCWELGLALPVGDLRFQATHHDRGELARIGTYATLEPLVIEQLKQRRETLGVPVVGGGAEEQAVLEVRRHRPDGVRPVGIEGVEVATRGSDIVRLIEDEQIEPAREDRLARQGQELSKEAQGTLALEEVDRGDEAGEVRPGIDVQSAPSAQISLKFTVDDAELQTELVAHLLAPLRLQPRRTDNHHCARSVPKHQLLDHQPGLDGRARWYSSRAAPLRRRLIERASTTILEGRYRCAHVEKGRNIVVVTRTSEARPWNSAGPSRREVRVGDTAEPVIVDLIIERGGERIEGLAVASEGGFLEGALVEAIREVGGVNLGALNTQATSARSVSLGDGSFALEDLSKGTLLLKGELPGYSFAAVRGVQTGSREVGALAPRFRRRQRFSLVPRLTVERDKKGVQIADLIEE